MNAKLYEDRKSRLKDATAIAIFRTAAPEHAVEGAAAAVRGGFEAVEVTLNTPTDFEFLEPPKQSPPPFRRRALVQ